MSEGGYIHHFPRLVLRKDKTNPRRIAYLFLLLFATPPSWSMMMLGTILVLSGITLHGWAAGYLARAGYEDRETILTLRGPYRHNRNPYYLAHMVMDLGFFVVAGLTPFYLLYGPLMFAVYRRWVLNEEPFLRQAFGSEYTRMCREVPRWGFRLRPAAPRGPDQRFTWTMYFFNGEQWRSGSHLLWLTVFWLYWLFANPFATLDPMIPATLGVVVAVHYVLHDARPRDVARLSRGWLGVAAAIALGGAALLANAPVWQTWPQPWPWLARAAGLALGGLLALSALRSRTDDGGTAHGKLFRVPMTAWYLVALALGLLSATPGGLWLAVIVSLTVWACSIAGLRVVRPPPRNLTAVAAWIGMLAAGLGLGIAAGVH